MSVTTNFQDRHYPVRYGDVQQCAFDDDAWPCDARQEGDRADAAERERDALRGALRNALDWIDDPERIAAAMRRINVVGYHEMASFMSPEETAAAIVAALAASPDTDR